MYLACVEHNGISCAGLDRVHQNKTNITYNADGTAVDYHQARHMEFVPHMSRGEENDTVTVPNIPAVVCTETTS